MATTLESNRAQTLKPTANKRPAESEPSATNPRSGKLSCPGKTSQTCTSEFNIFDRPSGRLEDQFTVDAEPLGAGQYGSVYRCTHNLTGQAYACKTILKAGLVTNTARDEVCREIALMHRVSSGGHPGVVQLHAVFEDTRSVHLIMDLCEGGELFDEVVRRGSLPEKDAARLFRQIVSGVALCHSRGVLHRDLKPENILLVRDPLATGSSAADSAESTLSARVADFGLSIYLGEGATGYGTAGSPFYMSPEVLTGEYSFPADVWSLGVILYIMLSGRPPFWGVEDSEVYDAVLAGSLDFSGATWNGVSVEVKGLIRCMLQRDPRRRPSAAKVLSHPWICMAGAYGGQMSGSANGAMQGAAQAGNNRPSVAA